MPVIIFLALAAYNFTKILSDEKMGFAFFMRLNNGLLFSCLALAKGLPESMVWYRKLFMTLAVVFFVIAVGFFIKLLF